MWLKTESRYRQRQSKCLISAPLYAAWLENYSVGKAFTATYKLWCQSGSSLKQRKLPQWVTLTDCLWKTTCVGLTTTPEHSLKARKQSEKQKIYLVPGGAVKQIQRANTSVSHHIWSQLPALCVYTGCFCVPFCCLFYTNNWLTSIIMYLRPVAAWQLQ